MLRHCFSWGAHRRNFSDPDFVSDAGALNEGVFVLAKLVAEFFNTLVLVEHLKFLKVEIPLLKLHALTIVFLHEPLSFLLSFLFNHTLVLSFKELATNLCLFLFYLHRQCLSVLFYQFFAFFCFFQRFEV